MPAQLKHTIFHLTGISTKQDEIDAFIELCKAIHNMTYLSALFSSEMRDWVVRHIEQDTMPDLFAYYAENQQALLDASQERDHVKQQLTTITDEFREHRTRAAAAAESGELAQLRADKVELLAIASSKANTIARLEAKVHAQKRLERAKIALFDKLHPDFFAEDDSEDEQD